jgi:adenylate cyclase
MERRLAAILAADVVGYSRLIRADEEGTIAALKALRVEIVDPKLAEHNGRIVKLMGDGMLVEFPSVVDAVRAAMEIQQVMAEHNTGVVEDARIAFRVGVNLGDVVIDGDDIQGDGVNIAARLEGLAPPGGVCISGMVYEGVRDRIDLPFEDLGEQPVKNIERPVRVWQWTPTAVVKPVSDAPLSLPDKPSIAVLPFENMSGDAEQEYFVDGLTEDIITELSRFEDLFVIARNTCFTYKGQRVDVKEVAQELGVRFVLEGSVRKAGQRVRITAQLIDGRDGGHVWAERYDGALKDVFDLQEQVTSQVVGSIAPSIADVESARIGRDERVYDEAHELAWRAKGLQREALRLSDPNLLDNAIAISINALNINVKCGVAYQTICISLFLKGLLRWGNDPSASSEQVEDWAVKFRAQLPKSPMAYCFLGLARSRKSQFQAADREFQYAHELNPNDSLVLRMWAFNQACAGEFESAKKHAHMAIRLSPKDSYIHPAHLALAMAAFIEKDSAAFEEWAGKAIQLAPHAPIRRAMMIAYAAEIGDQALLETHRTELMRFAPDFIDSVFSGENQLFQKPEHTAMLLDGLRKAGFSG